MESSPISVPFTRKESKTQLRGENYSSAFRRLLDQRLINLTKSLDSNEVISLTLNNLYKVTKYDIASIFLIKKNQAFLCREIGFRKKKLLYESTQLVIPPDRLYWLKAKFDKRNYIITNDYKEHYIWKKQADFSWIRSSIIAPIGSNGGTAGFIVVDSETPNQYSNEDGWSMGEYAHQVSIALNNARQYEQIKRQMHQLKALQEIDRAINSSSDLSISLEIVISKILQQLKPDAVDILLTNAVTHNLEYKAGYGFISRKIENNYLVIGTGLPSESILERKIIYKNKLPDEYFNITRNFLIDEDHFSSYFCAPMVAKGTVIGVIELFFHKDFDPTEEWRDFFQTLANQTAIAVNNAQLFLQAQQTNVELVNSINATIEGWVNTLDLRDKETEGHSQRVTYMATKLAQELNISGDKLTNIQRGALLHDIGKVGIPDSILLKPTPLTTKEWETMKMHPVYAYKILSRSIHLRNIVEIPYCHHERWDGSGYPRGLKGKEIPLAARIFAVVDQWDALTSDRAYRKAWPTKKVLEYIKLKKGIVFDPMIVDLFLSKIHFIINE